MPGSDTSASSPRGARPLRATIEERILSNISRAVETEEPKATFVCGGSIAVDTGMFRGVGRYAAAGYRPIDLFWTSQEGTTSSCRFPLPTDTSSALDKLVKDSQLPSSTNTVQHHDPSIERCPDAFGMPGDCLATSFCPYSCGIIDTVAQLLLASLAKNSIPLRGIQAVLTKLNVLEGPSGNFHAHTGTPSVETGFATLLVRLPGTSVGGDLNVTHQGETVRLDWSRKSSLDKHLLRWSAFCTEAQHSFSPIVSGHCVLLSYTLYLAENSSLLCGRLSSLDTTSLPLYQIMRDFVLAPSIMPRGGTIGFFCTHPYAHNNKDSSDWLPASMKGTDMAIYQVLSALGLQPIVRPICDAEWETYQFRQSRDRKFNVKVGPGFKHYNVDTKEQPANPRGPPEYVPDPFTEWSGVHFFNKPVYDELHEVSMTKEAHRFSTPMVQRRTYAAILARVPGYEERRRLCEGEEQFVRPPKRKFGEMSM
ncbi:hypothetical protein G7Y79_00038g074620 [Physcia stellaris]|nr:hypothetical protein G7Y79_00038g074620 [Physcia stellaris]